MILTQSNLGFTTIPGLTRLTPQWSGRSARISNGLRFGVNNGLGALGSDWSEGDYSGWNMESVAQMVQKGMSLINAQRVFDMNLDRLDRGLAPIPTQYASPTFNVGVAGMSPGMLLLAAAALIFLLKK